MLGSFLIYEDFYPDVYCCRFYLCFYLAPNTGPEAIQKNVVISDELQHPCDDFAVKPELLLSLKNIFADHRLSQHLSSNFFSSTKSRSQLSLKLRLETPTTELGPPPPLEIDTAIVANFYRDQKSSAFAFHQ